MKQPRGCVGANCRLKREPWTEKVDPRREKFQSLTVENHAGLRRCWGALSPTGCGSRESHGAPCREWPAEGAFLALRACVLRRWRCRRDSRRGESQVCIRVTDFTVPSGGRLVRRPRHPETAHRTPSPTSFNTNQIKGCDRSSSSSRGAPGPRLRQRACTPAGPHARKSPLSKDE